MSYPVVSIGCVANVYSRMMSFQKKGDIEHGHTHPFDHLTLLATGSLKVTVEGKETIFKAPFMIYIKAEKNHQLEALEDNTVAFCIHALRNGNGVGDIIDPASIPNGSDAREFSLPIANNLAFIEGTL